MITASAMKPVIKYFGYSNLHDEVYQIGIDEIHIWKFKLDVYQKVSENFLDYLTKEELNRVQRFHKINDKKRFVIAHIFLRILLSAYLRIPLQQIALFKDTYGKLMLEGSGNLSFNLSHSEDWVVLAFSKYKDVGVDIERIHDIQDFMQIAEHYFRKEEYEYISKVDTEDPLCKFYKIWTIKEAFVKATGEGLSRSLKTFSTQRDSVICTETGQETMGVWRYFVLHVDRNYAATVVINIT